jgi:CBS domain containing-hemolysin-like protein
MNSFQKILYKLGQFLLRVSSPAKTEKKGERPEERIESLKNAIGSPEADLEETEKKMIHSIFEFGETTVKEIMVPRIDMVCCKTDFSLEKIKALVKKEGHSRFPLYKDNIDNIVGILNVKDLFLEKTRKKEKLDLTKITRKAYFIPESKKIDELLAEMKKEKTHIAIVVDEYGGTAGLVTMEDILEEIVGEIQDEYDLTEEEMVKKIDEQNFRVSAKLSIEDLNEVLGANLPEKEFETVGGYIYDLVGSVPEQGKVLRSGGLKFTVEKVMGQRIETVKVTKLKKEISPEKKPHHKS